MKAFFKTAKALLCAQLRSPLFYVLLAAALACALIPLLADGSSAKAAVIVDGDRTGLSRALVSQATADSAITMTETDEARLPSALASLRNGSLEAVFVIEPGYEKSIQRGKYKGVVKLYLSPYSTSARTFADSFASWVMSQWAEHAAAAEAEKQMGAQAGAAAKALYEQGFAPIMTMDVEGEAAQAAESNDETGRARNALFLLSALACFMILCFSGDNERERAALLDRFQSRGWSAAAYAFARPALSALTPAVAALVPCVWLAASTSALMALEAWLLFLLFLLAWMGVCAALGTLARNPSVQLSLAAVLAIANAIFSYPSGLMQSAGLFRFLLPGYWFTHSLEQLPALLPTLPVVAVALGAVAFGIAVSTLQSNRN